jgi:serine/threonine protein phosphatase PrpC
LKAFGPIEKSLQNVKDIYKQKWFHHFLSVEEVIRSLSDQPPGTFLVRFSRSKSDAFALEYVESKGKVRTVLIKNNMPHGVSIAEEHNVEKTFGSIHQLIQHYSETLKSPFHSDLLHKNWFFGDISSDEAEEMLFGRPSGTFMIRFSDTGRFQYAASYVSKGKDPVSPGYIRHIQIMKVPSGFAMTLPGAENGSNSSSTTDELTPFASVVYPSLPKLIANSRSIFRFNYDPDNVPRVRLAEFIDSAPSSPGKPVEIEGPGMADGVGVKLNLHAQVAAQTLASYPKGSLGWQVVCDQFKIRVLGNRVLFVICDGCGWGPKPREAAIRAAKEIIDQMSDKVVQAKMEDTLDCKHFLLRSFNLAHEAILKGKEDIWLAGTTTLLAGMLLQIHPSAAADPAIPEWSLVCASVGDCKCFVWNTISKTAVDVTQGNRRNLRDASDPGGRIGPFIEPHGHPDLRNLAAYFWPLKNEEVVIAASDGIHDNLEPECIALTPVQAFEKLPTNLLQRFRLPASLPLPTTPVPTASTVPNAVLKHAWDSLGSADNKLVDRLKGAFMAQKMTELLQTGPADLPSLCEALMQHSFNTTSPSRSFMEQNPDKSEPKDRQQYPGKMDHCTTIALACPATYYIPPTLSTTINVPSVKFQQVGESNGSSSSSSAGIAGGKKKSPRGHSPTSSAASLTESSSSLRAEAEMLSSNSQARGDADDRVD